MQGNQDVIKALQAAAAAESHLNQQYKLDAVAVKFMGSKKLGAHLYHYGSDARDWLRCVTKRVLFLEGNASYDCGNAVEQGTLTATFQNELALEMAIIAPYEKAVQTAIKALDDTSRNLFEHLLKWHQKHVAWLECQLALIKRLGGEAEYLAEKI